MALWLMQLLSYCCSHRVTFASDFNKYLVVDEAWSTSQSIKCHCFADNVLLVESGDSHAVLECIDCLRSLLSSHLALYCAHFYPIPSLSLFFSSLPIFLTNLHILSLLLPHSFTSSHSSHLYYFITYLASLHSLFGPLYYLPIDSVIYHHIFVVCSK